MNANKPNAGTRNRYGLKSIFIATTVVGILLHVGISVYNRSFGMLGVNLLLFYLGSGIALAITSLAIMTLGSRASAAGALLGAAAWALLLSTVHLFEPSIKPYVPRHVFIFAVIAVWIVIAGASSKTSHNEL